MFDLEKGAQSALRDCIEQLRRVDAVLSYDQLRGLLFAINSSPEPIKPSEWFELIWLNDEPQFDNEADAKAFYSLINKLQQQLAKAGEMGKILPFPSNYENQWQPELAEWCQGFLLGHQYLEELWIVAIEDVADDELAARVDTTLNLAMTFADLTLAQQQSIEEGLIFSEEELPEAYKVFRSSLLCYKEIRRRWLMADEHTDPDIGRIFEQLDSVAGDELCPCGSGKVFAKCCLH